MLTHDLTQGTLEWAAHRATHFNASDAPAMLGCSPYKTRTELLHEMHTGLVAEVDSATQRRFDDGHRFEALARPLAAAIIGEALFPVTGSEGRLSASFDGLTMDESIAFEHKSLNDELRGLLPAPEMVEHEACNAIIPKHYRVQMQQQCMVSGATRVLFMATKWDGDYLIETRHCWYESDAALAAEIAAGWAQFEIDLAAYVPSETAPAIVAAAVTALPAVSVNVSGEIVVKDNFKAFETALRDFIEHRLIREPSSDQDFADLDLQIKALKGAEAALDAAEVQMLSQVDAVDAAKRTKDMLHKLTRDNRLMAEKLLATRKEQIKGEIVAGGIADLRKHIDSLNTRLGKPYMPAVPADFAGAAKNKRTVDSLRESVNQELTRCKIESNGIADNIQLNLNYLREHAKDHAFLFADTAQIVLKAPDDLQALVKLRISEHQAEVARKEEETRERIRSEEKAKLEREQAEAAQKLIDDAAAARRDEQNAASTAAMQGIAEARQEESLPASVLDAMEVVATDLIADLAVGRAASTSANVVPMRAAAAPAPAAAPATPPTMKLGDINALLSPIALTAEGLATLGFPAATVKSAKLYHHRDLTNICAALHDLLDRVQAKQAA